MTQNNVTAVRSFFEALNRGALDDAVAPLDPEVEFDWTRSRSPERGVYRGHEEVKRLYERFIESWTECEFFETEIFESGDAVVRVGGFRGRGKGSGVAIRASAAIVWCFRGGRAISAGMYQSKAEALEAVNPVPVRVKLERLEDVSLEDLRLARELNASFLHLRP